MKKKMEQAIYHFKQTQWPLFLICATKFHSLKDLFFILHL